MLSKSSLMATALASAIAVWMLTGLARSGAGQRDDAAAASANGSALAAPSDAGVRPAGLRVTVRKSIAEQIVRDVVVNGRTEPSRVVEIKAETEGRVVGLGAERGARVAEGERLVRLDVRDREAVIAHAEALIAHRRQQYEAALRLEGQQLVAELQIAEAKAELAAAEAQLATARLDLARTSITAPFDGVLEERSVELGDYVGIGDSIAMIADNDPLIAVGEVSERDVREIGVGSPGRVQLVDGTILEGVVRYVSPVADPNTRTFRIELAVPNPDNALPAGMTAEIRLPAGETEAHFLSPALLTLDDAGNIGVKTVDEHGVVRFHDVEIFRSASDGVWVTGLPKEAVVITVGQGFVAVGERVEPVFEGRQ
ncbi:MAG TPA: efflux RND transporter periplasmic adaptor subunit [Gammaproteobacteria bacterium]